jgi:hypothetical protein
VGRLTDAGLLRRERSAQDRRAALLTVTEKAKRRLAEFRDLRAELAGQALAQLAEQDRRALARAVPALLRLSDEMEHLAQSALFVAIFYGIQIIWERDAGVLTKLMVTPTASAMLLPRLAR